MVWNEKTATRPNLGNFILKPPFLARPVFSSLDGDDHLRLHSVDKLDFARPGVDLPAGDSSGARDYGSTAGDVIFVAPLCMFRSSTAVNH